MTSSTVAPLLETPSRIPCQRSATSGEALRVTDEPDPAGPLLDEVPGERGGARLVLGVDRVHGPDLRAGDQHELGAAGRERLDGAVADGAAEDDQAVAAAGHGPTAASASSRPCVDRISTERRSSAATAS